ncbi:MAG: hypothetical protein ACE5HV_09860 [Acidobacteriota bacterium]
MLQNKPLSTRLRPWLEAEIRGIFEERGEGPSAGLRRIVQEWWAHNRFPSVEFRDGPFGRRPAVRGGPEIWEIIAVSRDYSGDKEGLREHFQWLDEEVLEEALGYYERFPEETDQLIADNDRFARYAAVPAG